MQMTDGEVLRDVMSAKDQKEQISVCAELNCCSEERIKEILKAQGVDLRKLKTEKKKNIHGIKHKPHTNPANSEKMSPLAELNERIESLIKQKAGIESEIEDLRAQLTKMIDMLAGRIAE